MKNIDQTQMIPHQQKIQTEVVLCLQQQSTLLPHSVGDIVIHDMSGFVDEKLG